MATEKRQETVLGRLEALCEQDVIDDVTVTYWFRQAADTDVDPIMPSVVALESWASDNDITLTPAFDRHQRSNWFTGAEDAVVNLPVICLAILEDGDIRAVFPHRSRSGHHSVMEGIEQLEAEYRPEP